MSTERRVPSPLVLALDSGTSTFTGLLVDAAGRPQGVAQRPLSTQHPMPGWAEQQPQQWWRAACAVSRQLLRSTPGAQRALAAVVVTNQRETVVPLDAHDRPLHPAILWHDLRASELIPKLRAGVDPRWVRRRTGLPLDPYFSAPKLLWLAQRRPSVLRRCARIALVSDWLNLRLSGQFVTDPTNASRTLLYDLRKGRWEEELCDSFEVDPSLLPPVRPCGTIIGEVSPAAARATGLRSGLPVVLGGGDQQCAAAAAGVLRRGVAKATFGSGTFVATTAAGLRTDGKAGLLCSAHVVPATTLVEGAALASGSLYDWVRTTFFSPSARFSALTDAAFTAPPGAAGVRIDPSFAGVGTPRWDRQACGTIGGLRLGHGRSHIARAALEAICLEAATVLRSYDAMGIAPRSLRVDGGLVADRRVAALLRACLPIPLQRLHSTEATALGAALLGAVACGWHRNLKVAQRAMVRIEPPIPLRRELRPPQATLN